MRVKSAVVLLASLATSAFAVYSDEAFQTDYQHSFVGIPQQQTTFLHRPSSSSKASLLYTLSEKGVLGAINPKDGALVWRQLLAAGQNASVAGKDSGCLRAGEGDGTVISGLGKEVRSWGALDGKMVWGNEFEGDVRDLEVLELEDAREKEGKDIVLLMAEGEHGVVRKLEGATGKVLWEFQDHSADTPFQVSTSAESVFLICLVAAGRSGLKIKVTSLDPVNGKQTAQYTLSSDADIATQNDIVFVGANSASPIIAWTDKSLKTLKVNIIGSKHISSLKIPSESSEVIESITLHAPHLIKSLSHFLVHYQSKTSHWAEVYHIDIASSTARQAYSLPKVGGKGVFSTSTQDANVYFVRSTDSEMSLVSSASHGILARWPSSEHKSVLGDFPVTAVSEVIAKDESTYAIRSAHTTSYGYWTLVRNGESIWARAELLTGTVAATWAESDDYQKIAEDLKVEGHANPIKAYVHRLTRHVQELRHLPEWINSLPTRILKSVIGTADPTGVAGKDTFGFRKLVLAATENGHVVALSTGNQGHIAWDVKAVDLEDGATWDVKGMYPSTDSGHVDIIDGKGEILSVSVESKKLTRRLLGDGLDKLAAVSAISSANGSVALLASSLDGEVYRIAGTAETEQTTFVVKDTKGKLKGIQGAKEPGSAQKSAQRTVWEFAPASGERLVEYVARPLHDPVASIGRVLGNRSVLYKYLNLNLLLITSVNDALSTATITLLDSFSGAILHIQTLKNVDTSSTITSVLSENFYVTTLTLLPSTDLSLPNIPGPHLYVSELYESPLENDRGPLGSSSNYSSTDPLASAAQRPPHVLSQSFSIPEPVSALTITQSRQGITSRALICTLSTGIIAIPRQIFDARRPVDRDATAAEAEEGLARYTPFIEFSPKWFLTHKREVMGIKKVVTTPALVESTSLIFAFGLDVFGTRIAPSMEFDILGKGFGKLSLIGTVVALGVGVGAVGPLVRKKQINGLWSVS